MVLIVAGMAQMCGFHASQDDANTALDKFQADHPGESFAVFAQVFPSPEVAQGEATHAPQGEGNGNPAPGNDAPQGG